MRAPVYPGLLLSALLVLLVLSGCGADNGRRAYELAGATMGTTFTVTVVAERPPDDALRGTVSGILNAVEGSMSTYLIHSDVSQFNASPSTDWFPVSQMVCEAVAESLELSALTEGAFDVTVGPVVDLWGFGPDGPRSEPPDDSLIAAARDRVGYRHLAADCGRPALRKSRADLRIDLSAYAKGFAVDRVAERLEAEGATEYMVEIGGELRMAGSNAAGTPWRVAIESPGDPGHPVQRIVGITDAGMATSGDYRNFFEFEQRRYSHTIDPRTGAPVSHDLAAVTVVSEKAAFADGMATALLVLGPTDGMRLAERLELAVFFQRRTDDRFVESMSPAFRRIAGQGSPDQAVTNLQR